MCVILFLGRQRRESANELVLEMCISSALGCVCVVLSVCVHVPQATGEDVLWSDPQLHRALSLLVFHIIDSCSDIDRRCGGRKGKIGV